MDIQDPHKSPAEHSVNHGAAAQHVSAGKEAVELGLHDTLHRGAASLRRRPGWPRRAGFWAEHGYRNGASRTRRSGRLRRRAFRGFWLSGGVAIIGADLAGVMFLRTAADAERLKAAVGPGKTLAVVGGGYIGLEVAASGRAWAPKWW